MTDLDDIMKPVMLAAMHAIKVVETEGHDKAEAANALLKLTAAGLSVLVGRQAAAEALLEARHELVGLSITGGDLASVLRGTLDD